MAPIHLLLLPSPLLPTFRSASINNSFRFSLPHPWRAALTSQHGSTASASTSQSPLPHPFSSSFGPGKRSRRLLAEALMGCVLVGIAAAPEFSAASAESEEVKNLGSSAAAAFFELTAKEPLNALSVPTWTIHVASVAEWVTAMILVWQYGQIKGNESWKGLSWGMVPSLGGAMCACTWHFYYNAESLEALVVMQSALTLIGNLTLWIAAFRIYKSVQEKA